MEGQANCLKPMKSPLRNSILHFAAQKTKFHRVLESDPFQEFRVRILGTLRSTTLSSGSTTQNKNIILLMYGPEGNS